MPHPAAGNAVKVRLSKEHSNITTSNNGGGDVEFEEILDLEPPTDVNYELRDGSPGLHLLLELQDSGATELADDAELFWAGQGPLEENMTKLTRTYRYGEFANADQRDDDEKVRFEFVLPPGELPVTFSEAAHLKLMQKHSTAVDWSNSKIEFEIYRDAR